VETYETIGGRYDEWNLCPAGQVQQRMIETQLGDLTGRSVLDLGCGTGYYCRLFAARGARRVLGLDSSPEMLRHAASRPPDRAIEYRLGDAVRDLPAERFDLVAALWTVNQAENRDRLDAMTAGFARGADDLLLVTRNLDADWAALDAPSRRYGVQMRRDGTPVVEGRTSYECTIVHGGTEFSFTTASWDWDVLASSLDRAGYRTVRRVSPGAEAPAGLLACLPFMVLRASTA
jgi:toxoflavin synthase